MQILSHKGVIFEISIYGSDYHLLSLKLLPLGKIINYDLSHDELFYWFHSSMLSISFLTICKRVYWCTVAFIHWFLIDSNSERKVNLLAGDRISKVKEFIFCGYAGPKLLFFFLLVVVFISLFVNHSFKNYLIYDFVLYMLNYCSLIIVGWGFSRDLLVQSNLGLLSRLVFCFKYWVAGFWSALFCVWNCECP